MSDESIFSVGDLVRVKAIFRDPETEELVDPEVVVFTVRGPDAPQADNTTPKVEKIDTGEYFAQVPVDRSGRWYVAIDAAGGYVGAHEHSFIVRDQYVPRSS